MTAANGGGDIPGPSPDALARAEAALAALAGRWRRAAHEDAARLRDGLEKLAGGPADDEAVRAVTARMFAAAHDMKGQAATFGRPEITDLAGRLCRMIEAEPVPSAEMLSDLDRLTAAIEGLLAALPDQG